MTITFINCCKNVTMEKYIRDLNKVGGYKVT